jgi:hypothetical protein
MGMLMDWSVGWDLGNAGILKMLVWQVENGGCRVICNASSTARVAELADALG